MLGNKNSSQLFNELKQGLEDALNGRVRVKRVDDVESDTNTKLYDIKLEDNKEV